MRSKLKTEPNLIHILIIFYDILQINFMIQISLKDSILIL